MKFRIIAIEATERGTFNMAIENVETGFVSFCDDMKSWDIDEYSLEEMCDIAEYKDSHKHHFIRS